MLDNFHLDYKKMSSKNITKKMKKNNFPFPLKKTIANKKVSSKNKKGGNPPTIEFIGSIDELKDPKKRLAIRNFINNECVNKLENQELITEELITAEQRRYNYESTISSDIDEEYFSEISFYGLILDIEYKRINSKSLVSHKEKPLNYYMYKIMKAIQKLQRKIK